MTSPVRGSFHAFLPVARPTKFATVIVALSPYSSQWNVPSDVLISASSLSPVPGRSLTYSARSAATGSRTVSADDGSAGGGLGVSGCGLLGGASAPALPLPSVVALGLPSVGLPSVGLPSVFAVSSVLVSDGFLCSHAPPATASAAISVIRVQVVMARNMAQRPCRCKSGDIPVTGR